MTVDTSVQVISRWRWIIVAGVLIGGLVGWVSAPGSAAGAATFAASHTLIFDPEAPGGAQVGRTAALATLGPVRDRVVARLGTDRERFESMVAVRPHDKLGVLSITGTSADRAEAEALANATAEELIVELGGPTAPVRTLEPAVASTVPNDDTKGPTSRPGRALLLAVFGLVLGVGAVFAVERLDTRIRSKSSAENALGMPVVAEVPPIRQSSDRGRLLSAPTHSDFIEAYRRLRTTVDRWRTHTDNGDGQPVIVVTSPAGSEGATTTVAHLAATLGEIGRSVVVVSANLRRPQLHLFFDRAREPGLTDVLRGAPDTRRLTDLNLATSVRGVRFVASGQPVRNPSPLLDHIGEHLRAARTLGDLVLVDAPPLLTTSEAADLSRHGDGVLIVVRAGRTSIGAAARSAELLHRLGVPVIGAVLVGSDSAAPRREAPRRSERGSKVRGRTPDRQGRRRRRWR